MTGFIDNTLKPVSLAILIALGICLHAPAAKAGPTETLIVAGGCFWCVEADFEQVTGVAEVVSGYTGGKVENPTYKDVVRGGTGHYEAVKITFDAGVVSRDEILRLFFRSVDPTDAGGQFCDRGESYRTAIFPQNASQRTAAEKAKADAARALGRKIVTPILNAGPFYVAEAYHQDYYKGSKLVFTRAGPKRQSVAYKFYRSGCRRDERVRQIWGDQAPFAGG